MQHYAPANGLGLVGELPGGVPFRISQTGGSKWRLEWTDGGPNAWLEDYEKLSYVFLRLGCITACIESDFEQAFMEDEPAQFSIPAEMFLLGRCR